MRLHQQHIAVCVDESPRLLMTFAQTADGPAEREEGKWSKGEVWEIGMYMSKEL